MIKTTDYLKDKIKREVIEELRTKRPQTWAETYLTLENTVTRFLENYQFCDWYEIDYVPSDSTSLPSTFFTASIQKRLYNIILKPDGDIIVALG